MNDIRNTSGDWSTLTKEESIRVAAAFIMFVLAATWAFLIGPDSGYYKWAPPVVEIVLDYFLWALPTIALLMGVLIIYPRRLL
jgi:hypothetical protein